MRTREREGDLILWMIVNGDERLNEGIFGRNCCWDGERERGGRFFLCSDFLVL